jgi:uncharacterized protein (DUF2384 family)
MHHMNVRTNTSLLARPGLAAVQPDFWAQRLKKSASDSARHTRDPHSEKKRELIGVSPTTFRRKEEAKERLPDVAGHRLMGYLRVVATLRKLLEESGDPEAMKSFDVQAWVAQWVRVALPELGGKTPAEMLRNPEGQRAVEQVLERMRGGLVA